jgi:rubredoxin
MATPLSPDEMALFLAHTNRFPNRWFCPMCGTNAWTVAGVEAGVNFVGSSLVLGGNALPVVVVVCNTCFYVTNFAWEGIARGIPKANIPPPGSVGGSGG